MNADIEFFWDPVCPFAWITSRWIVKVQEQTDYSVNWRFISLRILNKDKDYATEFPEGYEFGHTAGLRMLRVAAAVRAELGPEPLGALVTAYGAGDALAAAVVERGAAAMGRAVALLHTAVGVERFVIIGGFARALGDGYLRALAAASAARCWGDPARWNERIVAGVDDDDSGLLGMGRMLARRCAP